MTFRLAVFIMLGASAGLPIGSTLAISQNAPASVHPELWPHVRHAGIDPASAALADKLLASMSIEEKVGQMIQADIASITPADLKKYKLGSILAGGNAAPGDDIRTTAKAWLDLTDEFYTAALADSGGRHVPIPILFGIDAVHGHAKLKGATIFPHNVGLGAAHDPDLIHRIGEATAAEVAETGIDWTFAPTVAVVRDVRWGRSYESYSESPELVAQYAPAMVTGLQGTFGTPQFMSPGRTLSSVKHFMGDGGTRGGRDQGNTVISEAELAGVHGAGYPPAIEAGALIVMASYNSWNGAKLHGNHYLLTDVLKDRMGFDGFVVGDWNAQEQVVGCTKSTCAAAILAGVDMLMAPDGWKELYENTLAQVKSGEISQARVDDAVRRILRVKAAAGLFSRVAPKQRSDTGRFEVIGSAAHRAIAREAVRKSLVLLKNAHHTLPLDPHLNVLVAGDAADDIGVQSGGWTIDWQGNHNTNADFPGGTSIYAGIKAAVTAGGGTAVLSRDGKYANKPDVAVIVYGEGPYAEFEGDRETVEYSPLDKSNLAMLRRLQAAGIPTVSVFISGRPLWVNPEINASDAFVAAWLPGSEGGGIADILFSAARDSTAGDKSAHDFTGRLAFSWPLTGMPVSFDAKGVVSGALYPRGYGLSYTATSPPAAASPTNAAALSEDAHIPPHWQAPRGSLFHAQHVTAPWSLFVADGDAEVHVTNDRQDSPHGAVSVTVGLEGAESRWNGKMPGMMRVSGRASDMRPRALDGSELFIRYRVDRAPAHPVSLGMRCTVAPQCASAHGAMIDVTSFFQDAAIGTWQTLSIPIACFSASGADLSHVDVPFAIATDGPFGVTIGELRLTAKPKASTARCPGGGAVR
jgi:beta-glucosidase